MFEARMFNRIAKRTLDLCVSATGLLVLSPLLLLLALLVASTSRGGVLFVQKRIGQGDTTFKLLKFRTMRLCRTSNNQNFDAGDTTRVTAIGRVLRRTKLDELPQLMNVVRGDMSLVGPRPEVPEWTEVYPERWKIALSVRPGITDPASIVFRNEEEILAKSDDPQACYRNEILPRKLDMAEEYVRSQSFLGDLVILLKTMLAIIGINTGEHGDNTRQSSS